MTEKLTTAQLLQPQRLEGEDFETYKKRRKDMSKVVRLHVRGQPLAAADLNRPAHSHFRFR